MKTDLFSQKLKELYGVDPLPTLEGEDTMTKKKMREALEQIIPEGEYVVGSQETSLSTNKEGYIGYLLAMADRLGNCSETFKLWKKAEGLK